MFSLDPFPANEALVSSDLIRACALVKASLWENLGASLINEDDLQFIREHIRHDYARMVKVLTTWKKTNSPKVAELLGWFKQFDVSRRAIKEKYEERQRGK